MGLIGAWRAARERRRLAERYLRGLLTAPETDDMQWLSTHTGSIAAATRELVFVRRAIALIVAERDALDDRTASDVSHVLAGVIGAEARASRQTGREWALRWRAYSATQAARGQVESPAARMARVMLEGAGIALPSDALLTQATQCVQTTRARANESLRAAFGEATLPEDIRPSALQP